MEHQHNTALLVLDIQQPTVNMLKQPDSYLATLANVIKTARSNNMPVIYVVVAFRAGYPEVSANNKSFSALKNNGSLKLDGAEALQVHAAVAPAAGEVVVVKKRVSAFTGSDLEVLLRAVNARHLVLTGISTSGVVLSTLREGADKDYVMTVLADCCADVDEEVHRVLTTKIFPRQATVINAHEWIELYDKK